MSEITSEALNEYKVCKIKFHNPIYFSDSFFFNEQISFVNIFDFVFVIKFLRNFWNIIFYLRKSWKNLVNFYHLYGVNVIDYKSYINLDYRY